MISTLLITLHAYTVRGTWWRSARESALLSWTILLQACTALVLTCFSVCSVSREIFMYDTDGLFDFGTVIIIIWQVIWLKVDKFGKRSTNIDAKPGERCKTENDKITDQNQKLHACN